MNYYLTHFSLHEVCSRHCSPQWMKEGIDYLKAGGDSATWKCLMYGC